jgi:hypothetical protein
MQVYFNKICYDLAVKHDMQESTTGISKISFYSIFITYYQDNENMLPVNLKKRRHTHTQLLLNA